MDPIRKHYERGLVSSQCKAEKPIWPADPCRATLCSNKKKIVGLARETHPASYAKKVEPLNSFLAHAVNAVPPNCPFTAPTVVSKTSGAASDISIVAATRCSPVRQHRSPSLTMAPLPGPAARIPWKRPLSDAPLLLLQSDSQGLCRLERCRGANRHPRSVGKQPILRWWSPMG
jgi:hypothetical protein|uniref:Uncharacterized protein n=1 Tax=Oryza sativa subsp. japonica TaxID=39947 RepID=Q7EYB4_ORYSJ|nr:hypothetical protein [Oryza sativa Japonica Group]BAD01442.1 hypothetical protein [Oryza sativa Japonica Group]